MPWAISIGAIPDCFMFRKQLHDVRLLWFEHTRPLSVLDGATRPSPTTTSKTNEKKHTQNRVMKMKMYDIKSVQRKWISIFKFEAEISQIIHVHARRRPRSKESFVNRACTTLLNHISHFEFTVRLNTPNLLHPTIVNHLVFPLFSVCWSNNRFFFNNTPRSAHSTYRICIICILLWLWYKNEFYSSELLSGSRPADVSFVIHTNRPFSGQPALRSPSCPWLTETIHVGCGSHCHVIYFLKNWNAHKH